MTAVNYSTLRSDMKTYMDAVSDSYETIIVTRKGEGRNIVMLSEGAYNNLLENSYIRSDPANYSWLMESKKQLEEGRMHVAEDL